jgi:pimeloyl-ACP methyl ester carboxylesterase
MRAIIGWSVADRLKDISCPTLVIGSDKDYTPVAEKGAYVERIARAILIVIEDSRHALPLEKPGEFNAAVEKFLVGLEEPRLS